MIRRNNLKILLETEVKQIKSYLTLFKISHTRHLIPVLQKKQNNHNKKKIQNHPMERHEFPSKGSQNPEKRIVIKKTLLRTLTLQSFAQVMPLICLYDQGHITFISIVIKAVNYSSNRHQVGSSDFYDLVKIRTYVS